MPLQRPLRWAALGGGSPKASGKAKSVRGLALAFQLPGGEQWQMDNISAPVFFVSKPEQFAPFVQARTADTATTRQGAHQASAPVPASYGAVNRWGVNAFEVEAAPGKSRFVRWQFVPEAGVQGLNEDQLKIMGDAFLASDLRERAAKAPASFDFRFQLAEAGDNLTDPTLTWPDARTVVWAGKLVIDRVSATPYPISLGRRLGEKAKQ